MKLLTLLIIALGLLSAGPADARHHHHRSWQHSAVPMPRERPNPRIGAHLREGGNASGYTQRIQTAVADGPMSPSSATTETRLIAWDIPKPTLTDQLVLVGWWRLKTEEFWRR